MPFNLAGATVSDPRIARPGAGFQMEATPGYFGECVRSSAGKRARVFTEQDRALEESPVALVNEAFVHKYLAGKDPLTQRVEVEELIPGVTKLGASYFLANHWRIYMMCRTGAGWGIQTGPRSMFPFGRVRGPGRGSPFGTG